MSKCPICTHDKRLEIDRKIVAGKTISSLAKEYGIPDHTFSRHKSKHIHYQLQVAYDKIKSEQAGSVIGSLNELIADARSILTKAKDNGHNTLALAALRELRSQFELISKIEYAIMQNQQAMQLQGMTPDEIHEFREWKANRLRPKALDLNLLNDDERELVRSIAVKKIIGHNSGVTSKRDRASTLASWEDVIVEPTDTADVSDIASTQPQILDDGNLSPGNKMQRTR